MTTDTPWPPLPFSEWSATCETLHMWTQIVGKVRMALTPLVNHWWNVTLHVTSRGLTSRPIPYGARTFCIDFDFIDHRLIIETSDGSTEHMALAPMAVADFYSEFMGRLKRQGIDVHIWTMPNEVADAIPFDRDHTHCAYDDVWANRFWLALLQSNRVMNEFRAGFIGKASPVHFFWGSFDLAASRFSGRTAPPTPAVAPHVASWAMQEAYSHEVCSCGFWPGNGGYGQAAFYVYAYPEPAGLSDTSLRTPGAFYDRNLREFILPYDAVREARESDRLLLSFLQETYEAAANLGNWDRTALERPSTAEVH